MILGYTRKPTKFEWCGTSVWLLKLTKADRESVAADGEEGSAVRLVALSLCDESGSLFLKDKAAAEAYFSADVAEADFAALFNLVIQHSGWNIDSVELQKKS